MNATVPPAAAAARPARVPRLVLEYAAAAVAVLPVTAACWWTRDALSHRDQTMVFLLGVLLVASRVSRGPSLANVLLSVAAFDFFFVDPPFTFNVADRAFLVTFAVMLAVGFTVSTMTMRVREQAESGAAARVAAETERTRNDLLTAVSHDLRTPLASISGAAGELLEAGDALPAAERRELLETIRDEGVRLGRLVDGLLELTRLEAGTFRPAREWCPVEEIVGSALGRLEERLEGREVRVDLPDEVLLADADAVLVEHVLVNLIENAHKFAPPGTPVEVAARAGEGAVVLEVRDRGPGFAAGEEARVFDRYFRGSAAGRAGGWGLGLAISRAIVRVHGGAIAAERREGGGAILRFTIPAGAHP